MRGIGFEILDPESGLVFRDAIWLDENEQLSDGEIEAIKTLRFQNWLKAIQPQEE